MEVYIIKAIGTSLYKLGIAENAQERKCQLQTGSPFRLKLVFRLESEKALKIEQRVHSVFSIFKVHGEWFDLKDHQVITVMAKIRRLQFQEFREHELTRMLCENRRIFNFTQLELKCGLPKDTLQKIHYPNRLVPARHVDKITAYLKSTFGHLF